MSNEKITTDIVADALLDLCANQKLCDEETVTGLKHSKKKNILKSKKEGSFNKFTNEIIKRQAKKEL